MAGKDNLIPQNRKTKDEQRRIAKMGGIRSGEVRRQKKFMRELFADYLSKGGTKNVNEALEEIITDKRATSQYARVAMIKELREAIDPAQLDINKFFK